MSVNTHELRKSLRFHARVEPGPVIGDGLGNTKQTPDKLTFDEDKLMSLIESAIQEARKDENARVAEYVGKSPFAYPEFAGGEMNLYINRRIASLTNPDTSEAKK